MQLLARMGKACVQRHGRNRSDPERPTLRRAWECAVGHVEVNRSSGYPGFVASPAPYERFSGLDYEAFRQLAGDSTLSSHERSGFPDSMREGAETAILADIEQKLPALREGRGSSVVDIGCGANPLTGAIIGRGKHQPEGISAGYARRVVDELLTGLIPR